MQRARVLMIVVAASLLLALPPGSAEVPFATPSTVDATLSGPVAIAHGDFDGDGLQDLVVAAFLDTNLAWFRNLGDGTYARHQVVASSADIRGVEAADLDGDGDLDLVVAAAGVTDAVGWYENDGTPADGPWALRLIAISFDGANDVAVADFNGDGTLDVAATAAGSGTVAVALNNNGTGIGWSYETVATGFEGAVSLAVGDIDDDGKPDLVGTAYLDGEVAWWNRTAPGAWSAHLIASVATVYSVELADVSGDGQPDVVVGAGVASPISWFENSGHGAGWITRSAGPSLGSAFLSTPTDLDLDGDLDLPYVASDDDEVGWLENTSGDGLSWERRAISTSYVSPAALRPVDLDHDGDCDLAVVSIGLTELATVENLAIHRSALLVDPPSVIGSIDRLEGLVAGDFDHDGDVDLVTADWSSEIVQWHENTAGDGSAWSAQPIRSSFAVTAIAVGDVTGDQVPEVIGSNGTSIKLWLESGGGFVETDIPTTQTNTTALAMADLDGDGDTDLVAAAYGGGGIDWYENTGGGGTWTESPVGAGNIWDADSMVIADIDQDGAPDVVVGDFDQVVWFPNRLAASSNFATPIVIHASLADPRSVAVGDVDQDGDPDVVSVNEGGNEVLWWANTSGDGSTWGATVTIASSLPDPRAVTLADFDLDGDLDVAIASEDRSTSASKIVWAENLGVGLGWHSSTVTSDMLRPGTVLAADLDGDGDPDLIADDFAYHHLFWWSNQGAQAAVWPWPTAPAALPWGVPDDVLSVTIAHLGRTGDDDIEPASLVLELQDELGTPLSDAEATALLRGLYVFVDEDASGDFDPAIDSEVAAVTSFTLAAGRLTVPLPDHYGVMWASRAVDCTLFVAVVFESDAAHQVPDRLQVVSIADQTVIEDRDYDLPVTLEPVDDVASGVVRALGADLLFYDGFESSDTSAWSSTAP